tara:strand:- start:4755 stop:5276 length:522 start_codon:yes stop_codon:yes gene_type:complete
MWKDTIRKTDILKRDYDIAWEDVDIDNYDLKNVPKEWVRKEGENTGEKGKGTDEYSKTYNYVEFSLSVRKIEGGIDMDIRTWGVKGIGSSADKITCTLHIEFEDDKDGDYRLNAGEDIWEDVDFTITDIEDEPYSDDKPMFNPSSVSIKIDMKDSISPSNWETSAEIEWQGSY